MCRQVCVDRDPDMPGLDCWDHRWKMTGSVLVGEVVMGSKDEYVWKCGSLKKQLVVGMQRTKYGEGKTHLCAR